MGHWEATGQSDEWYTPRQVFDALGVTFYTDVASPKEHWTFVPAINFITEGSLEAEWIGPIWMNPQFGKRNGLKQWLDKFFVLGNGVALVPDRTSAPWFQDAWRRADMTLFTPKLQFIRPDGSAGKSPSTGSALFAVGEFGKQALTRAAKAGLGILGKPMRDEELPVEDARHRAHQRLRAALANVGGSFGEMPEEESLSILRVLEARASALGLGRVA
ncbi:DNA N-6-adenine-methyltransferase [Rhizobium rhizogenes]|uniref:DNA N-6-adenine-methyltransferase n=1 Tax=Rhizobium rhizogenes TaxID=359 RepID=UPI001574A80D|nr:DNA N-6-adenine-methyltransferase [Rhizobium rhizogenes]NTF49105.1 adenine methyltransferase [Rhizobium rhizogenes]NTH06489.1 adenine methyltransferase [Rhizobium rhizogenes]